MMDAKELPAPTRAEVEKKLIELIEARITRVDVEVWARQWIYHKAPWVRDNIVRYALRSLATANNQDVQGAYFHKIEHFRWLVQLLTDGALRAPTREQIEQKMLDLIEGRISREEACNWAGQWFSHELGEVEDGVVWNALGKLMFADLDIQPGVYGFGIEDFHSWLADLRNGVSYWPQDEVE